MRVCVFCGDEDLTREHAFPQWIGRDLAVAPHAKVRHGARIVREGASLDIKIRAVCKSCNQGWMIDLEMFVREHVGPSMRVARAPFTLDPSDQEKVACWAVKTALMLELALRHARGANYAPESHFEWLYANRSVPPNCRVWIFGVDVHNATPIWTLASTFSDPGVSPPAEAGYLATFTAGYVGFQVLGFDLASPNVATRASTIQPPSPIAKVLELIWPATSALRWPPPRYIDSSDLQTLAAWPLALAGPATDD